MPRLIVERFVEETTQWFLQRCEDLENDDSDLTLEDVMLEFRIRLREAQEDPELPSMKVGMFSVCTDDDTGKPTHIKVLLENGVSVNWEPPTDPYELYTLEYTVKKKISRWKTITKEKSNVSPYKEEFEQKDRKDSRFNKLRKNMSRKLPVEE